MQDQDAGTIKSASDKAVKFVKDPYGPGFLVEAKRSKRQVRREAREGKPVMIAVPRGGPRGLRRDEIRRGLDASRETGEPTYLQWDLA